MGKPTRETTISTDKGEALLIYYSWGTQSPNGSASPKGFALKHGGRYAITINSSYPEEIQAAALEHELLHINLGHFDEKENMSREEKETEVDNAMGYTL